MPSSGSDHDGLLIVAPFAPGGATDLITRIYAEALGKRLGVPVAIENEPGDGGTRGAVRVARAKADGRTLLMGSSSTHGICSAVFPTVPYDWAADFKPIAPLVVAPNVLVVSSASGIDSVADLVARARAKPGTLTFGSAGFGQTIHLCGELFRTAARVDIVHAPRVGSAVALEELADGRLDLMFDNILSALPYIRSGRLRALAVTSAVRCPQLADVPTMIEAGVADYDLTVWIGVLVRSGTPQLTCERLEQATRDVLDEPAVRRRLEEMGAQRSAEAAAAFAPFMAAEARKWARAVERTGVKGPGSNVEIEPGPFI